MVVENIVFGAKKVKAVDAVCSGQSEIVSIWWWSNQLLQWLQSHFLTQYTV